ncbi:MAG TPA: UDP-3-O-[3-hydroxymyristoyl] N-acetylglucosamine deacetylase [Myxococcales bacterium]|nr:UDP-3-O-[3-hydroxymyristoyl] N-acetylglucosamine deacetylase [Myxococcales bacterium]
MPVAKGAARQTKHRSGGIWPHTTAGGTSASMELIDQLRQRTIESEVRCSGVGLHTGAPVRLTLKPAPENHGVTFRRTDVPGSREIPARAKYVVDTALATSLGRDGVRVGTVEHLCATLCGLGIDNLRVELDGPEVPIMDGSAAPFAFLVRSAGIVPQQRMKKFLVIRRKVAVRNGDKEASLAPAGQFTVSCNIDFKHPLISDQSFRFAFSDRTFHREVARARTFGFVRDIEALKRAGLARGGSLDNAIVVDDFSILNPDGLRFPNEFVRHKVLDAVGDLFLFGMPVIGHLNAHKSGHALNHKLVTRVLSDPSCYEEITATPKEIERLELKLPALGPMPEAA